MALTPTWPPSNTRATPRTDCARGRPMRKPLVSSAPPTIHGVRRPKRDRVASDRAPATGWAKMLAMKATVVTMARFPIFARLVEPRHDVRQQDAGAPRVHREDRD